MSGIRKRKGRPKKSDTQLTTCRPEIIMKLPLGQREIAKIPELSNLIVEGNEYLKPEKESHITKLKAELAKKTEMLEKLSIELEVLNEKVEKYIGKKQEFIELKVPVIHKNGTLSVIEKNNDLVCFYCTHTFDNEPCFIPEKYDNIKKAYHVFGNFCSFSCASRYNNSMGDYNVWNRNSLLVSMFRESIKNSCADENTEEINIPECPPRESLIEYGGNLTIEEFRERSILGNRQYQYVHPSMVMKKSYVEELHKKPELFDSLTDIRAQVKILIGKRKKQKRIESKNAKQEIENIINSSQKAPII